MKNFLIALIAALGLFPVSLVQATPAAESCLNEKIEYRGEPPKEAQIMATVEHGNSHYHMIRVVYSSHRNPKAMFYLRTDDQGGCEKLLSYLVGSYPSEEVYIEKLGPEVYSKLTQQFSVKN